MLTVLVPAHKAGHMEGSDTPQIVETIQSLQSQTTKPDRIIVLANNGGLTDGTIEVSQAAGAEVVAVPPNPDKKAGALNYWLGRQLESLDDQDLILVMDADSALNPDFIENGLKYINKGYHCVGGIFLGKEGGGFVGMLQRNEYARYARDVARKKGRTLVLTGTATIFTAECLKDVVAHRSSGGLPSTGDVSYVYDTKALTEDNELTYALLHLGYEIVAPPECGLKTEVMETWLSLAKQRYRWKRGAVENNRHYGITRLTFKYWWLQWWGVLGINATVLYLITLGIGAVSGTLNFHPVWVAVTALYMMERVLTVKARGWKQSLMATFIIIEMPYDLFLQAVQVKALFGAAFHTKTSW